MLPILRIIPVGGVFLAIMILVLALSPPDGSHPRRVSGVMPSRGPLQQIEEHPEWRQFLMVAALRRADELGRLRDLPDAPLETQAKENDTPVNDKVAGLPVERLDADPEDATGSIPDLPGATIPVEIGAASSAELPTAAPEEKPPVIKPRRAKMPSESRRRPVRVRQVKPAKPPAPAPQNIFEALFGSLSTKQASNQTTSQQPTGRSDTPAR
jgi:hypothetical protein